MSTYRIKAKLKYVEEGLIFDEGLTVFISFREEGRLFNTKMNFLLIGRQDFKFSNDRSYISALKNFLDNEEKVISTIEDEVRRRLMKKLGAKEIEESIKDIKNNPILQKVFEFEVDLEKQEEDMKR